MITHSTLPRSPNASFTKSALVDIGLDALSRGDWQIVMAITRLIQRKGMRHV